MDSIGRYTLEKELGAGTMGVVYLATDPRLDRRIALKTYRIPDGVSQDQRAEFRERFLREARAAGRLSHPGIVTVHDAGIDAGRDAPYIVMEYVAGRSLKDVLADEGRLPPERAIAIGERLAEALQVAHEGGIVHRDIKPANILVRDSDGAVKIADFGVARLSTSELTRSGETLGSPAYMSPEQVQGAAVDGRSDLFSLAVILYEMLSGTRPFRGDDLTSLVYSIAHETPIPVSRRAPGLPPGLDEFFDRALAKDPGRRFPDGATFRDALERAARCAAAEGATETVVGTAAAIAPRRAASDPPEETARSLLGRRWWVAVAAALVLLLGGWLMLHDGDAHLRLDAKSAIESGVLTLHLDGEVIYTRELAAPVQRKGFLKKVLPQQNQETFEAWLDVPSGKHEIAARIEPAGHRGSIVVDLEAGEKRTLRLVAGRTFGSPMSLKLE